MILTLSTHRTENVKIILDTTLATTVRVTLWYAVALIVLANLAPMHRLDEIANQANSLLGHDCGSTDMPAVPLDRVEAVGKAPAVDGGPLRVGVDICQHAKGKVLIL